jgi:hypothetical protein
MTPAMEGETMQGEPAMVPTPAGNAPTNATRRVPANNYNR